MIRCIWNGNATLGEGPIWNEKDQSLFWVDIERNKIYQLYPETGIINHWVIEEQVTALAICQSGLPIVTYRHGFARFNQQAGTLGSLQPVVTPSDKVMFNDGKCHPSGKFFYAGTKSLPETSPTGALYRLDTQGKVTLVVGEITVANGPAFSPDGKIMYFADSPKGLIFAFDVDPNTGDLSGQRTFTQVAKDDGYPDGMTVDREGCLWSAHWGGWRITRYKPDGSIDRVIKMPVPNVTSLCFGGKDYRTLFVTSAARDVDAEILQKAPQAGSTFAIDMDVAGVAEGLFALE